MNEKNAVGTGVSFKRHGIQTARDIRELQETGSVVDSITNEQRILDRVSKETGENASDFAGLL